MSVMKSFADLADHIAPGDVRSVEDQIARLAPREIEGLPGVTETQRTLVQESFKMVAPIADQAAELFYARLFELDPRLRPMFRGEMAEQRRKLMAALTVAVNSLDAPAQLTPVIEGLGRRHKGYGVVDSHYDTVGAALLWTLEQGLGDHFTSEVGDAWGAVYGVLATVMKAAAGEAGYPEGTAEA